MVFVDKATEAVAAYDRPSGVCEADWWSALGYSQIETAVGSLPVVVIEIGLQHGLKVEFGEDKDPVETFSSNGSHESLGVGICPRGSPRGANDLDSLGLGYFIEDLSESKVTVVDKEAQWRRTGLSWFGQVAGDVTAPPHIGRVPRDATE